MPDFFHLIHDIVKSYSLAIGRRLRHAQKELTQAEERLTRRQPRALQGQDDRADALQVETRRAEVTRWREVQRTTGQHLETLSLTLHPFHIDDATAQTSQQVAAGCTRRLMPSKHWPYVISSQRVTPPGQKSVSSCQPWLPL